MVSQIGLTITQQENGTNEWYNNPGFTEVIDGPELVKDMKSQARRFDADLIDGIVANVDADEHPFRVEHKNVDF